MKINIRMTPYTLLLIGVTTSILCGCDTPTQKDEPEHLTFDVDTTLLGTAVSDTRLNIKISPPKNWEHTDTVVFSQNRVQMTPQWIFLNKTSGSRCIVVALDNPDIASDNNLHNTLATAYKLNPKANVTQTTFTKGTFRVQQIMVVDTDWVLINLIFNAPQTDVFCVMYQIPKSVYKTELRAIESSIGSIKPIEK